MELLRSTYNYLHISSMILVMTEGSHEIKTLELSTRRPSDGIAHLIYQE